MWRQLLLHISQKPIWQNLVFSQIPKQRNGKVNKNAHTHTTPPPPPHTHLKLSHTHQLLWQKLVKLGMFENVFSVQQNSQNGRLSNYILWQESQIFLSFSPPLLCLYLISSFIHFSIHLLPASQTSFFSLLGPKQNIKRPAESQTSKKLWQTDKNMIAYFLHFSCGW